MKFKGMKQAGFSLVELMVVVGIIGILAAIAVPKLQVFTAKAKQSEAKSKLNNIYTLNEAYFAENSQYSATLATIGYSMPTKDYGDPTITLSDSNTAYTAKINLAANRALCKGTTNDWWITNNSGNLKASGRTDPGTTVPATNATLTCD